MKAVVKTKHGIGNVVLKDVDIPSIKSDEVLIRVKYTGICGTDLHIFNDSTSYTTPIILGHEYSGIVEKKGLAVKEFSVGDRVTSPATIPCGSCVLCKTGFSNRCIGEQKRILGAYHANGTFTKYLSVPSKILHKIPENLTLERAAVAEPVACIVHAVFERVRIEPGDTVVVLGPGAIGLLCIQAARLAGANNIVITGTGADRERLLTAKKLGANITVNVEKDNPVEVIMKLTKKVGADVVLEASGSTAAQTQAFTMIKKCGRIGLIGLSGRTSQLNLDSIVESELEVKGSWGTVWKSWRRALILLSSDMIKVSPLITNKLSIDEWDKGFKFVQKREALKVLLLP
jgi:threonine dehydrogenase-like Zn-dependent dehydrogenase